MNRREKRNMIKARADSVHDRGTSVATRGSGLGSGLGSQAPYERLDSGLGSQMFSSIEQTPEMIAAEMEVS
jgi:hypothetical protein